MKGKLIFIQKIKDNNYIKIFIFSLLSVVIAYAFGVLFAFINEAFNVELLLYIIMLFIFLYIYNLFNKKFIKASYTIKNLIIPGFLFLLILVPFLNELVDEFSDFDRGIPIDRGVPVFHKPVIYLYPEYKQKIKVELDIEGKLIADYPRYNNDIGGWEVTAYPDGKIINNGKEYSYLFWEAEFENNNWDLSKGFIVEGKDSREFLEEKLSYIGLTPKEYNEFIVYWYPKMMNNKYNLVYFAGLDYDSRAPLDITPNPDSILRVFTVIKPLDEMIEIKEQQLEKFERKGFSVVEWGGTILD